MIADHFKKLGGQVSFQEFRVRSPLDGSPVAMANLIVQWHPDRPERILLCAITTPGHFPTGISTIRKGRSSAPMTGPAAWRS